MLAGVSIGYIPVGQPSKTVILDATNTSKPTVFLKRKLELNFFCG